MRSVFFTLSFLALSCLVFAQTEQWDVVDLAFTLESTPEDPFALTFGAEFRHEDGISRRIPGFYNGGGEWLIRFCPPEPGAWQYRTYSSEPALAGQTGTLEVAPNTKAWQHGPIAVDPDTPQQFVYADGTPYFLMAFELDWLFALDAENDTGIPRTRSIIGQVAANGFNQVVMNVYAYDAGWGEKDRVSPEHQFARPPYSVYGGSNEAPDYSTLNVEFFQKLDRVIAHLNEQQIVAHLMIYVWNKMVNWPEPESPADNRYFDYVVKRYQAYPNLIWDISKEALAYGRDDLGYITRRIERLRRLDGHGRLLSVHDYNYCAAFPEQVDFISIQEWQPYLYYRMREVRDAHPDQPIFNIEHGGYEKTMHSIFDGAYTDPLVCLDRTYQCVFAGTYSTYYWQNSSWYEVVYDPAGLPEANRPHFAYYRHLRAFFEAQGYQQLRPRQDPFAPAMLTNGTDTFIYYLPPERVGVYGDLPEVQGKTVRITWFDPLTGASYDGGQRDFGDGKWLGIRRDERLSGALGIVILEIQ